jgi:Bacterial protein of unknown function (DUF839)
MKTNRLNHRQHQASGLLAGIALACAGAASAQTPWYTNTKPYAVAVSADYVLQPLISVGDQVPNTSDPSKVFQMIGIPDGLGATKGQGNKTLLYMNHELGYTVLSEPNIGGPLNRGAFISRWTLDKNGSVISGERAYNTVSDEELGTTLPAAEVGNTGRPFGRFCSGSLSFREAGFDRPIYLTGEESGGAQTFDGKGGLGVAVIDNVLHTLVKMGRFAWENTLARPDAGEWTVVMGMEDGPASLDNQLYMYVGKKDKSKTASVLSRNGLDTGKLYTFVCDTPGHWVELPDQTSVSETDLETQTDALGAFTFVRIEDGAWDKKDKNRFYFVTTGSGPVAAGNVLGRAYQVDFDKKNILGTTKISMIYNGDTVAAAGGDIGFAPDNADTSKDYLMIQEDGTSQSRPEYTKRAREGSIWRHDLKNGFAAKRVVELNPPGTEILPPATVPPTISAGVWETSGIIDASSFFGNDSWLFVVQAHGPSIAPAPNTVEDGQLLLMLPSGVNLGEGGDDNDDD